MAKERDATVEFGRKLMSGAMLELGKWMIIVSICVWLLNAFRDANGIGFDDTDDVAAGTHSGLSPLTDHKTGCQYVRVRHGGITPRLGVDGKQICR